MPYPYTGYQYPYANQYSQYGANTPQQSANSIIWVQGESGAKSYLVAPGASVLLMDSEAERFYIKSSDNAGMPQPLRIFEYKEVTQGAQALQNVPAAPQVEYVTREEYDALAARVDALTQKKGTVKHEPTV